MNTEQAPQGPQAEVGMAPEWTVEINGPSQRGKYRFIIKRDGKQVAIPPVNQAEKTGEAAEAIGLEILNAMRADGYREGYEHGKTTALAEAETGNQIDRLTRNHENAIRESAEKHEAETATLRSEHNARVDGLKEKHRHEIVDATRDGYDRGQNKGAIWGLIVASTCSIGAMFLLYHFGALDRWFG